MRTTQHIRSPRPLSGALIALWLVLGLAPAATAQQSAARSQSRPDAERLVLFAYSLEHRPAAEALELTLPLLSARGTARLAGDGRTLEVRDTRQRVQDIVRRLRAFDRPGDRYRVEVMVIKASTLRASPQPPPPTDIPPELIRRWQELLPYDIYELVARAELAPHVAQDVIYELGAGYQVSFQLQPIYAQPRVKLQNFRLLRVRQRTEQELIHTNLNPWLGKSLALGLARDEASKTALMVVIRCHDERPAGVAAEKE
jgi:hypothetical protein